MPERPMSTQTSPARMVRRALVRRCPLCGSGKVFTGYFAMKDSCPRCGLHFARIEGSWTGDLGINMIVTVTLLFAVLIGGTLLMWNNLQVALLVVPAAIVAVGFPIAFYPFAKTLWLAFDLIMRPIEEDETPGPRSTGHRAR